MHNVCSLFDGHSYVSFHFTSLEFGLFSLRLFQLTAQQSARSLNKGTTNFYGQHSTNTNACRRLNMCISLGLGNTKRNFKRFLGTNKQIDWWILYFAEKAVSLFSTKTNKYYFIFHKLILVRRWRIAGCVYNV